MDHRRAQCWSRMVTEFMWEGLGLISPGNAPWKLEGIEQSAVL